MNYAGRLQKMRQFMDDNNISAAIISKPMNQYYLTGFLTITYSRPIYTVIDMDNCSMILPGIEEDLAKSTSIATRFFPYFEHPAEAHRGIDAAVHLNALMSGYPKGARVGVELGVVSSAFADTLRTAGFEPVEIGGFIMSLRQIKEAAELDIIRQAGRIASLGVAKTIEASRPGVTETEIDIAGTNAAFAEASRLFPEGVLDKFTMSPSGAERTYLPHAPTGMRKLESRDMILHNRQMIINGYHAECQRTYFIGKPSAKQAELFNIMCEAQQAAIDAVKPGVPARELDAAARAVFARHGLDPLFNHRAGKGVGLEMLEEPYLRFDNDSLLEENMAISLHPGIYYEGEGGFRHSDSMIITNKGCELVTNHARSLQELTLD